MNINHIEANPPKQMDKEIKEVKACGYSAFYRTNKSCNWQPLCPDYSIQRNWKKTPGMLFESVTDAVLAAEKLLPNGGDLKTFFINLGDS